MHSRLRKISAQRRPRRFLSLNRLFKNEGGTQLVELALVIPIFLVLFGATAEFGRYFYEYTTLAKASRAGARFLATSYTNSVEDTKAKNIIVYGNPAGTGSPILSGLTAGNVTITRTGPVPCLPETVKVQIVNYTHVPIFDLGKLTNISGLSTNVDVKPSVTMRFLLTQAPPPGVCTA